MNKLKSKKFTIYIIVLFFILLSIAGYALISNNKVFAESNKGSGTKDNPYRISSVEDFNQINYDLGAYYVQTCNIDFSNKEFIMVGRISQPFTGHYDGGNFLLKNIILDRPSDENIGIFSFVYSGASIKNVRVENAQIMGYSNVGGIAGANVGSISDCYVNANIQAVQFGGGIVGNNAGTILSCANASSINVDEKYAGGIAALNYGRISYSYNKGEIVANTYVGGIAAVNNGRNTDAIIECTFNIGSVSGKIYGNITGDNLQGTIKQNRWIENENVKNDSAFNSGKKYSSAQKSIIEFKNGAAFLDWQYFHNYFMYLGDLPIPILKAEYVKVTDIIYSSETKKLKPGESTIINAKVFPEHATIQTVDLSVCEGEEYCEFNRLTSELKIKDDAIVGKKIVIVAKSEDVSKYYDIEIIKVSPNKINLNEINNNYTVVPGGKAKVLAELLPLNTTIKDVRYISSSPYVDIDYNGNIIISKDAPIGHKFTITAQSFDNLMVTSNIEFTIVEPKIDNLEIKVERQSFKVTESILIKAFAYLESGDVLDVDVKIESSTAKGAELKNGILYAKGIGQIILYAECKGVKTTLAIDVNPEPVVDVEFVNNNKFYIDEDLILIPQVIPANATYDIIEYEIIGDNKTNARINDNILTAETAGDILIRIKVGNFIKEKLIYAIDSGNRVSVEDIVLGKDFFKITESLLLEPKLYPNEAIANVYYEIVEDNGTRATIINNVLTAKKVGKIVLRVFTKDFSKLIEINAEKEPVQSIILTSLDWFKITSGLQLGVTILPRNATNQQISYEIIGENNIGAFISAEGFIVANKVGEIKVRITVDDISQDITIKALKEAVTDVKFLSNRKFKHTESLLLHAMALPLNATFRDIIYEINYDLSDAENPMIINNILYADTPGIVVINMKVDGKIYKTTIDVLPEPVISVNVDYKTENGDVFKTSNNLLVTPTIYPLNATNQQVIIEIVRNVKLYDTKHEMISKLIFNGNEGNEFLVDAFSELYLAANLPGVIYLKVTSVYNPNITFEIGIEIGEEYVDRIELGFDNDTIVESIRLGEDLSNFNSKLISKNYFKLSHVYMLTGKTASFKHFNFAAEEDVEPSYIDDYTLVYYMSEEDCLLDVNRHYVGEEGSYLEIDGTYLKANSRIGTIWLVAITNHARGGELISQPTIITIYHINIFDIRKITFDKESGKFSTLNAGLDIIGYEVAIKNGDKIDFCKRIVTKYIPLYLKLYRYSLQEYEIEVNLLLSSGEGDYFEEVKYKLDLNGFNGFLRKPSEQIEDIINDKDYNSIVIYDFSFWSYREKQDEPIINLDCHTRYLYFYGDENKLINGLDIAVDTDNKIMQHNDSNGLEITFNGISFVANGNKDALRIYGDVELTINIKNNVSISGGKGSNGTNGANGKGYNYRASSGRRGDSGEVSWIATAKPDGGAGGDGNHGQHGENGKNGEDGQNGGFAIRADKVKKCIFNIDENAHLTLKGGDGGNGGNGGTGGNGQSGGHGGNGGDGCLRYVVVANVAGKGGNGGAGGNGGNAGAGGNGGNAGAKGLAINNNLLVSIPKDNATITDGSNGTVGKGAKAGVSGLKGYGGAGGAGGFGIILLVPYHGKAGKSGNDGNNGNSASNGKDGIIKQIEYEK